MSGITQANFTFSDFRTAGGEVLPEVTLAYVTRGTLAADGRNAILITHGYTSGPRMIEPGVASSEGAWSTLVGPGAPPQNVLPSPAPYSGIWARPHTSRSVLRWC